MKRFKTWKRWSGDPSHVVPFRMFVHRFYKDEVPYIVMQQADYRKMKSVFDAAMRWHEIPSDHGWSREIIEACEGVEKACAKAAKP